MIVETMSQIDFWWLCFHFKEDARGSYSWCKYAAPDQNLCQESVSVPTTNANPEQDFGMLDRLMMKLKPKALEIVYEGIMFTSNNTRGWRNRLLKLSSF